MKCVITGNTRGIGKAFYDHFANNGWEVVGLNRTTGLQYDQPCDLFINNAYADGQQINFIDQFKYEKMIVCGSVAADVPDLSMPVYSQNKRFLEDKVYELQQINQTSILLLKLSGGSYNNVPMILDLVELWLKHPGIATISFAHGERNALPY